MFGSIDAIFGCYIEEATTSADVDRFPLSDDEPPRDSSGTLLSEATR